MMKSLRPHVSTRWQATTLLWAPAPAIRATALGESSSRVRLIHQQAGKKAAYTTQSFSGNRSFIKTGLRQAPSRKELVGGRALPLPAKSPLVVTKGRASYSTGANVGGEPTIHDVFESKTGTFQYVVADPKTLTAVIIDPVLDYDPATQVVTTDTADSLLSLAKEKGYKIDRILETHAHADHLTAASYLQHRLAQEQGHRPSIGIGKRIVQVQKLFGGRYGVPAEEYEGVFDVLFDDDETFDVGELKAMAMHLPGHTPDHLGYKIGDNVFCGDSVFHMDIGTARCDFPGGSASNLFASGKILLGLSDNVKIWTGHDYPPEGRGAPVACMSVEDHKKLNKHLKEGVTEEEFVALRKERDASLGEPRLLHQSLQMNIRAGRLPKPTDSRHRLLHLPLKLKGAEW